jgi:glycosyltransferase involved in cell wall biosynthesis
MSTTLKTTIVVATLNSAAFVERALRSIEEQSRRADEVVVVDGGSTDATLEIVKGYEFATVVTQNSMGYHRAWNEAIGISRGDVLCFLDSDDVLAPSAIERALTVLEEDRQADVVFGKVQFFPEAETFPKGFREHLKSGAHHADIPGSMFVRRTVFERIGRFPDDWQILSDVAWFADLARSECKVVRLADVSLSKCVRENSLSLSAAKQQLYSNELKRLVRRQFGLR